MQRVAIFIDGSNLVGNLQKRGWPAFIDLDHLASKLVKDGRLVHLLYGFSSPHPTRVPRSVRLDQQAYHDTLRGLPHISLGEGWRSPPNYDEKAVDVKLAIHLVMMARNDIYDIAYLVTADSDLAPAVDMVRQIGKRVVLVYFWDKDRPKDERRYPHRLAQAASDKTPFRKKWATPYT